VYVYIFYFCYKDKNIYYYQNNAVNLLLFIQINCPEVTEEDFFKVIKDALAFYKLLCSRKGSEWTKVFGQ